MVRSFIILFSCARPPAGVVYSSAWWSRNFSSWQTIEINVVVDDRKRERERRLLLAGCCCFLFCGKLTTKKGRRKRKRRSFWERESWTNRAWFFKAFYMITGPAVMRYPVIIRRGLGVATAGLYRPAVGRLLEMRRFFLYFWYSMATWWWFLKSLLAHLGELCDSRSV